MTIDAWIAERERIAEAATAGPWIFTAYGGRDYETLTVELPDQDEAVPVLEPGELADEEVSNNWDYIADARTSLPAALAWMKEAAKVLDWMAKQPCACRDGWRCWRCECVRLRVSGPGGE